MKYKKIKKREVNVLGVVENEYIVETMFNTQKYVVKPLDTLASIAFKFNKTAEEIKKINNLANDKLFIGQMLNV